MTKSTDGPVEVAVDGTTVVISLNRPAARNALDEETIDGLHTVLAEWRNQRSILIVRSSTPGMFVAGADIAELMQRGSDDALRRINVGLFDALAGHRWPTIAAIDGHALGGGCELALACDFRLATPTSVFGQPEADLGIIAGAGANWRLERLVGLSVARRILLAGERLDGEAALAVGLVDQLHPADELLDAARELAERMAARSWQALELTKAALRQADRPTTELDVTAQAVLFESEDKRERLQAFLDRKRPSG